MSSPEIDQLVCELGCSLAPAQRLAFEDAARAALAAVPCLGVGAAYRILADLQRLFFDPPLDVGRPATGPRFYNTSRLRDGPAIAHSDGRKVRYRRLRAVG
jgi:hypothetical protein